MAGRPAGSANKDKPFRDALRAEIAAAQNDDDFRSLRQIARKLLRRAGEGDVPAIREIGDRLDGKVPQAIVGDNEHDPVNLIAKIERVITDIANTNGEGVPPAAGTSEV